MYDLLSEGNRLETHCWQTTSKKVKDVLSVWNRVKLGSEYIRIRFANGVGFWQQIKIWSLGKYVLSLYSSNITEHDVKPQ